MPTVQDRRSGPLTKCSVCGARGSDTAGEIDLQCVPDSCPYIDRMLRPRAEHRLQGADPHGDVVVERPPAPESLMPAGITAADRKLVSDLWWETQTVIDARTLAAYAFALADGKVLAGFEFTNLAEIGGRYGMAALPESRSGDLPTPVINWLDAQARRQADRYDAAQARMRPPAVRTRPRLARLWAFLTGAAS